MMSVSGSGMGVGVGGAALSIEFDGNDAVKKEWPARHRRRREMGEDKEQEIEKDERARHPLKADDA